LQRSNEQFGQEQAQKVRDGLHFAIADSRAILGSQKHSSIMNLRNKYLAHSLSQTWLERLVLCLLNGASFSFTDSKEIHRKNAKALWEACTFSIIR
jgi:hypothetical protein